MKKNVIILLKVVNVLLALISASLEYSLLKNINKSLINIYTIIGGV